MSARNDKHVYGDLPPSVIEPAKAIDQGNHTMSASHGTPLTEAVRQRLASDREAFQLAKNAVVEAAIYESSQQVADWDEAPNFIGGVGTGVRVYGYDEYVKRRDDEIAGVSLATHVVYCREGSTNKPMVSMWASRSRSWLEWAANGANRKSSGERFWWVGRAPEDTKVSVYHGEL